MASLADVDGGNSGDHVQMAVADWSVAANGNVSIVSAYESIYLGAQGSSCSLLMDATSTASLCCGPAQFVLTAGEAGGTIAGTAGADGSIQLFAGVPEEGSAVYIQPETMTLQIGIPDTGAAIKMTPESITISVGPPGAGASIAITPESITLKVAEVTFTLTAEGITEDVAEVTREITPEGHNFTAAETEFNVGVQGQTGEGPTQEDEVEAGTVENETLGSDTTDAAKNVDAAIQVTL